MPAAHEDWICNIYIKSPAPSSWSSVVQASLASSCLCVCLFIFSFKERLIRFGLSFLSLSFSLHTTTHNRYSAKWSRVSSPSPLLLALLPQTVLKACLSMEAPSTVAHRLHPSLSTVVALNMEAHRHLPSLSTVEALSTVPRRPRPFPFTEVPRTVVTPALLPPAPPPLPLSRLTLVLRPPPP